MEKVKNWFMAHKRDLILCFIAVLVIVGTFILGRHSAAPDQPPIQTVQQTDAAAIKEAQIDLGKFSSDADAKEVSRMIGRAQQQAPVYQYFTTTDKAADEQAEVEHADYVIKQQDKAAELPAGSGSAGTTVYENKYYSINQQRKHDIKIGAAAAGGNAYATVSYRNRDIEYTVAYDPVHKDVGAGVAVTVAKW